MFAAVRECTEQRFAPGLPELRQFTLGRHQRLVEKRDYGRVFADSVSVANRSFLILANGNDRGFARLGLAVAKRRIKHASHRNRVKRAIRESFRLNQALIDSLDVVVLVSKRIDIADRQQLKTGLDALWIKLKKKCAQSPCS